MSDLRQTIVATWGISEDAGGVYVTERGIDGHPIVYGPMPDKVIAGQLIEERRKIYETACVAAMHWEPI